MTGTSQPRVRMLVVVRYPVGGIRTYIKYTYKRLEPRFEFTFLAPDDPQAPLVPQDLMHRAAELVRVPRRRPVPRMIAQAARLLRARRYDVIHAHGVTAGVISALANASYGLPLLVTLHDVFREDQFRPMVRPFAFRTIGLLLGRANVVQSVTHDAEANLRAHLPHLADRTRLVVIPNGIDVGEHGSPPGLDRSEWRARVGLLDTEAFVFGFLGRLMPQKGFLDLVEATRRLAEGGLAGRFVVLVVGDGGFGREYRARVQELGLSDYFTFASFQSSAAETLKHLDALVMPSLWEAAPLLAMEALVAGCPLIASNCVGLREVAADTPALSVEAGDPSSLARGMASVLSDPSGHRLRATEFAATAMRRFDVGVTASALTRVIDNLVAAHAER